MQQRRVAVVRTAGRRRLRRLVLAIGLVAVTFGAGALVLSPLLDVDRVVVTGGGPRTDEVRRIAQVDQGDAILLVDTGAVDERVETLPWVARATVERDLPGTLRISVTSRPPVAAVARSDGRFAVVDATGTVVSVADAPPEGLPAVVTTTPDPGPGARIRPTGAAKVASELGPLEGRVARVFVEHGRAALLLVGGTEVRLGNLDHVAEKARAAGAVLASLGGAPVVYVDVSVPSAPVTA